MIVLDSAGEVVDSKTEDQISRYEVGVVSEMCRWLIKSPLTAFGEPWMDVLTLCIAPQP